MRKGLARAFQGAVVAALLAWPAADIQAQRGGPFVGMAGSWSGGGTITTNAGVRERIRCRGSYSVGSGGHSLEQTLRCASDSYRFDLNSSVVHNGGSITGTFSEASRGVGGRLSGRATAGRITALVEGSGFSASVTVSTSGDRQSVTINSPGNEVSQVSISLRRG